ncbi:MAG: periplasmic heavy metal sensor [Ignavibacteriaceae bacterium]|nr:periplasmic heavy metal sensor [Ignavibacteriaceae bacterium]
MQNRNLYIIIGVLVLLNIFSVGTFWFRAFDRPAGPPPPPPDRPELVMAEELNLSPEQVMKFKESKEKHKFESEKLISEIFRRKNDLMQLVFSGKKDKSKTADSLIAGISRMQGELELITYKHFSELASFCEPHQLEMLRNFTQDMSEKWHRRNKHPLLIR